MKVVLKAGSPVSILRWDGVAWQVVFGQEATKPEQLPPVHPPTGPLRNIISGGSLHNLSAVSNSAGIMMQTEYPVIVDAERPVAEIDLPIYAQMGEVTIQLAVASTTQPTPRRLTIQGVYATAVVSEDGATSSSPGNEQSVTVRTDPFPIDVRAGESLRVYGWISGPAEVPIDTTKAPSAMITRGDFHEAINQPATPSLGGGLALTRLIAPSDKPAWILTGDSIVHQWHSLLDRFARHFGLAHAKHARGGAGTASDIQQHSLHGRFVGNQYATHLIDQLGVNRWVASEQLELWKLHRESGIQTIVKCTLPPRAGSTDGYATLEGQTAVGSSGPMRDWLMDGAPVSADWTTVLPVGDVSAVRCKTVDGDGFVKAGSGNHPCGDGGVIDVGAAVRDSTDQDKFAVNIGLDSAAYGDGVHYGDAMHQLFADRLIRDVPTLLAGTNWR